MAKFHINATGNPGICRAANGRCPFGGEEDHFGSPEQARAAFESRMSDQAFPTVNSRVSAPVSEANASRFDAMRDWDESYKRAEQEVTLRKTASISAGIKSELMEKYYGAGSYEATIQKAKDRAGYASSYFADKAADSSSKRGSFLDGNASVAPAAVADRTRGALSAAGAIKSDSTRVLAHASAGSNPLVADALAARREERSSGLGISTRGLERFGF